MSMFVHISLNTPRPQCGRLQNLDLFSQKQYSMHLCWRTSDQSRWFSSLITSRSKSINKVVFCLIAGSIFIYPLLARYAWNGFFYYLLGFWKNLGSVRNVFGSVRLLREAISKFYQSWNERSSPALPHLSTQFSSHSAMHAQKFYFNINHTFNNKNN